ncbi:hypothetical protein ACVLV4_000422 [Rathayibacter agropyri]
MKTTSRIITSFAAAAIALAALTACSPQEPTPVVTDAGTASPTATPTLTQEPETPTPAPAVDGPTQEQAEALKADVVLTIAAGSNSAVYNGTTFDCTGNPNAPVFDGAPLNAANINLQLDASGAVISHECFYALTDEQLFG